MAHEVSMRVWLENDECMKRKSTSGLVVDNLTNQAAGNSLTHKTCCAYLTQRSPELLAAGHRSRACTAPQSPYSPSGTQARSGQVWGPRCCSGRVLCTVSRSGSSSSGHLRSLPQPGHHCRRRCWVQRELERLCCRRCWSRNPHPEIRWGRLHAVAGGWLVGITAVQTERYVQLAALGPSFASILDTFSCLPTVGALC